MDNKEYEFNASHKVAELYSLFRQLADGLNNDHLRLELELHPGGSGKLLAMEQRHYESVQYPPWMVKQRNQATWYIGIGSVVDNLELGLVLLRGMLNRKRAHEQETK